MTSVRDLDGACPPRPAGSRRARPRSLPPSRNRTYEPPSRRRRCCRYATPPEGHSARHALDFSRRLLRHAGHRRQDVKVRTPSAMVCGVSFLRPIDSAGCATAGSPGRGCLRALYRVRDHCAGVDITIAARGQQFPCDVEVTRAPIGDSGNQPAGFEVPHRKLAVFH